MFSWTKESISWYCNAAKYSNYHKLLAQNISKYLSSNMTIADCGCGTGFLSAALSNFVKNVISIDTEQKVLDVVNNFNIPNITTINGDAFLEIQKTKPELAVFCFFGRPKEIIFSVINNYVTKHIVILPTIPKHNFSKGEKLHTSKDEFESLLQDNKITYEKENLILEFGQPFTSFCDAELFFDYYYKLNKQNDSSKNVVIFSKEEIQKRLITTQDTNFPFYLPAQKNITVFYINNFKEML